MNEHTDPENTGTIAAPGGPPGFAPRVGPTGFELLDEIGRGGMGVVYRALDFALDREVAVKVLHEQFETRSVVAARFLDEARITGRLQHPGIPAVYQVGMQPDGRPFLAMRLIRGQTLAARLADGPPLDPLPVFEAISQAVGYAHSKGVIHRDLKPSNVMVGAFGEVQVMDWGLAKEMRNAECGTRNPNPAPTAPSPIPHSEFPTPHSESSLTMAGSAIGTPAYMPPEQATGDLDKIDRRSDVFGLGGLLCALLTGEPPFVGWDAETTRRMAAAGRVAPCFDRLDACGADPDVVALCKRCLAFERDDRPASGDEVAQAVAALRRAADDRAKQAERDKHSTEVRVAEQAKRQRMFLWAMAAVAGMLLLGVAGTKVGLIRANAARQDAEAARHEADAKRDDAEAARAALAVEHAKAVAKEAETAAVFDFFQSRVIAAARPKGQDGGLGPDVKLRDALTASLRSIPAAFADKPMVEARLRLAMGQSFLLLGDPAAAEAQALEARRVYASAHGPNHVGELPILKLLVNTYIAGRRQADAARLGEELVARMNAGPGPDSADALAASEALAFAYAMGGRHDDAFRLRERVVAARSAALGPDHADTLQSVGYLAASYTQRGRHADAIRLHSDSHAKLTAKLGPDHATVLAGANNLANGLASAGRHAEALALREDTFARRKKELGEDHTGTLMSLHNLAASYAVAGRHKEATERGEEVVRLRTAKLGRDNDSTLRSMANLADSYTALGRHADGLKLWEETFRLLTTDQPPEHPDVIGVTRKLAEALLRAGRGADAVARIDEGLARVGNRPTNMRKLGELLDVRLRHFEKAGDGAGCRATADIWDKRIKGDADDLYDAACLRAVAARVFARAKQPAEATADADRAAARLTKAVAAGYDDRVRMEKDPDLSFLRDRPDFQKLAASLSYTVPPPRPKPER